MLPRLSRPCTSQTFKRSQQTRKPRIRQSSVLLILLASSAIVNLRFLLLRLISRNDTKGNNNVNNNHSNVQPLFNSALKSRRIIIKEDEFTMNDMERKELDDLLQMFAEQDLQVEKKVLPVAFNRELEQSFHQYRKQLLQEASMVYDLNNHTFLQSIPTWNDVVRYIGEAPRLNGWNQCANFRSLVPLPFQPSVGSTGMYHSGAELASQLLQENCLLPAPSTSHGAQESTQATSRGILNQVPWGINTPARLRLVEMDENVANNVNIYRSSVLPIVIIRHPYLWMASMCRSNLSAKWEHFKSCPHLVKSARSMKPINVKLNNDTYKSLAHLWNEWYNQYLKEADFPFIMVRYEDLIFHTKNVTSEICQCAGGKIRTDRPFHYLFNGKIQLNHAFEPHRLADRVWAWRTHGKTLPIRGGFSKLDYKASRLFLDAKLMQNFGYQHPRPL